MKLEHYSFLLIGLGVGLALHALLSGGMRGTGFSGNIAP